MFRLTPPSQQADFGAADQESKFDKSGLEERVLPQRTNRRLLMVVLMIACSILFVACGGPGNRKTADSSDPVSDEPAGLRLYQAAKAPLKSIEEQKAKAKAEREKSVDAPPKDAQAGADANKKDDVKAKNEAEAKYQAELHVHRQEVERLKATHKDALVAFEKEQDVFKKATLAFEKARAEYFAAVRLASSRPGPGASKGLLEIAKRQYREIIDNYPDTQAAKDAAALLAGGNVTARKIPEQPVAPKRPSLEPPVLTLPPPPPSPEEVALAQTKAAAAEQLSEAFRKERAAEEKARAAAQEYDVNGLVLLLNTLNGKLGRFGGEITGTVVNRRDRPLRYVQIKFNLYDKNDERVGTALANITDLEPGERWSFKAVTLTKFERFKVFELTGR